jgi:hypothetical protein
MIMNNLPLGRQWWSQTHELRGNKKRGLDKRVSEHIRGKWLRGERRVERL